ncbi:MAG TPA: DUF1028 domain-containing protein [Dongiaceae bacterium]|jgi:uncharacterized Ntn-hydrolase superfamily protein
MTFSIAGRCAKTGMFGIAISTSSIAVSARCPWVRAGVGAVSTQNVTDPRLGPKGLDLLEEGMPAPVALEELMKSAPHAGHRQVLMIDAAGRTAHWTGANALGTKGTAQGKNCVSGGNLLKHAKVPEALVRSFESDPDRHLADRLIGALEAGLADGGEAGPVHSAGVIVMHEQIWPLVDLRVDWADENPIAGLRKLWQAYQPQMQDYVTRALNPEDAPKYGVPGDP